ncbi:MAG: putative metallo-hydrolase YycJ [Paracidovorax wautersii]|uniref:Putative metallo-hydrolase YycJ n=1 Tax=Paracidovorax wautersii TaxID=1177982 RepID=A0A7V8FM44_9BURK|nr:MAG: putative metallo-hydrolase YycJ [Paracidovorax wautersii]
MLRFRNLASGSTGNATVVEALDEASGRLRPTRLLVDCGLGIRQLQTRLATAELLLQDIDAIFITHEHSDHIGCAEKLAQRLGVPVWMSRGTRAALERMDFGQTWCEARDGGAITVGDLALTPFTVPHDAREPLQLTCTDGRRKLGILTDLGVATPHVMQHLQQCQALIIECNHDPDLLAASRYPYFLQRRIAGNHGHLANAHAAEIVTALMQPDAHDPLGLLVAAHLSQENNRPELARQHLEQAVAHASVQPEIAVADPVLGTTWHTV